MGWVNGIAYCEIEHKQVSLKLLIALRYLRIFKAALVTCLIKLFIAR